MRTQMAVISLLFGRHAEGKQGHTGLSQARHLAVQQSVILR